MGTMLQKRGLPAGKLPETLNVENPDMILDIHKEYVNAGADIITSNTFGANPIKTPKYEEYMRISHNVLFIRFPPDLYFLDIYRYHHKIQVFEYDLLNFLQELPEPCLDELW